MNIKEMNGNIQIKYPDNQNTKEGASLLGIIAVI